jgi:hypothetical protein
LAYASFVGSFDLSTKELQQKRGIGLFSVSNYCGILVATFDDFILARHTCPPQTPLAASE